MCQRTKNRFCTKNTCFSWLFASSYIYIINMRCDLIWLRLPWIEFHYPYVISFCAVEICRNGYVVSASLSRRLSCRKVQKRQIVVCRQAWAGMANVGEGGQRSTQRETFGRGEGAGTAPMAGHWARWLNVFPSYVRLRFSESGVSLYVCYSPQSCFDETK